jgi:predicted transcriptional regulator
LGVAYTTAMTTLDRLYHKHLLSREVESRSFRYKPRFTKEEMHRAAAGHLIRNHQQHRFVLSALWELPFGKDGADWIGKTFSGIELSPILTLGSGRPVNPLTRSGLEPQWCLAD